MIGKEIRSFNHLKRVINGTISEILFTFDHYNNLRYGKCVLLGKDKSERILVFNNYVGDKSYNYSTKRLLEGYSGADKAYSLLPEFTNVLSINPYTDNSLTKLIRNIIVLPQGFSCDYEKFCESNKKFMSKYSDMSCETERFKYIYCITNGSKNFFNWAIALYYNDATPCSLIRLIMCWNEKYSQMAKELSKGTITAYTSRTSAFSSYNEMRTLRDKKRANDAVNFFNTAQKKLLKECNLTPSDIKALSQFERLSPVKKRNFVKKMSSVNDVKEILSNILSLVRTKFTWNKKDVVDFITNSELMKCKILIDRDNILLVKAENYEAIKQLGHFTSWCISKNKHYWDEYVESRNNSASQYVLFDFGRKEDDKLSIVGFTSICNKGITNAHNLNNEDIMGPREETLNFVPFIPSKKRNNIYSILSSNRISLEDVTEYDKLPFEWSKTGFIEYLKKYVSNFSILSETETTMVLSVVDEGIVNFFGRSKYLSCFDEDTYKYDEHIIFLDFSLSARKPEKILFAIIFRNEETSEDVTSSIYDFNLQCHNYTFNSQLVKHGLPYDIISRNDNIWSRFHNAFVNYDILTLKDIISQDEVKNGIVNKRDIGVKRNIAFTYIEDSLFGRHTFALVDVFYDNGISLSDLIGYERVGNMMKVAYDVVYTATRGSMKLSYDLLAKIREGNYTDTQMQAFVNYSILNHIAKRERDIRAFRDINAKINKQLKNDFFDKLAKIESRYLKCTDFHTSQIRQDVLEVIKYGINNKIKEILDAVTENKSLQDKLAREGVVIPSIAYS